MATTGRPRPARRRSRKFATPAPEKMGERGSAMLDRMAEAAGCGNMARLVQLWLNWEAVMGDYIAPMCVPMGHAGARLVIGAADNMAMQELSFLETEILERANAFLGQPTFSDVQVRLVLDHGGIACPDDLALERPADIFPRPEGSGLAGMDPDSPAARAYLAFAGKTGFPPAPAQSPVLPPAPAAGGDAAPRHDPDEAVLTGAGLAAMRPESAVARCYRAYAGPQAPLPCAGHAPAERHGMATCPAGDGSGGRPGTGEGNAGSIAPQPEGGAALTGAGLAAMDGDSPVARAYRAYLDHPGRPLPEDAPEARPAGCGSRRKPARRRRKAVIDGFARGGASEAEAQERPARLTGAGLAAMDPGSAVARCYRAYRALGAEEGAGAAQASSQAAAGDAPVEATAGAGQGEAEPGVDGGSRPAGVGFGFHTGGLSAGGDATPGGGEPAPVLTGKGLAAMDPDSAVRRCYAAWVAAGHGRAGDGGATAKDGPCAGKTGARRG